MPGGFARWVVRHPWWTIGLWLLGAVLAIFLAPPLPPDPDTNHSLPGTYEAVRAANLEERAFRGQPEVFAGGYIVVKRADGAPLTDADIAKTEQVANALSEKKYPAVTDIVTDAESVASDRSLTRISVLMHRTMDANVLGRQGEAINGIRADLPAQLGGSGLTAKVGGDAAAYMDNLGALTQALEIVTIATFILIIGLILLIFRAPLAAILPILTIMATMQVALSVTAMVAQPFGLVFDQSLSIVVLIVIFGIGADYFLFLLWRFREGLRSGFDRHTALAYAIERAGKVIIGTALTTAGAMLCLLVASFRVFMAWGPALAIAVGVMALTALTLIPALIRLLGTAIFWPSRSWRRPARNVVPATLGALVAKRPLGVAMVMTVVMGALASGLFVASLSYDIQGGFSKDTEAAKAQAELVAAVPGTAGMSYPVKVLLRNDDGSRPTDRQVRQFVDSAARLPGVGDVEEPEHGSADPSIVRVHLLLDRDPFNDATINDMRDRLRDAIHAAAPTGMNATVGGITAGFVDIDHATRRDLPIILITAAVLIALVLMLVLRSFRAPLFLVPAVLLGFAASLGSAAYVFQTVRGEPGLNFQLPVLLYLFVLAIGTDYNILMIHRIREERQAGHSPRAAASLAVQHAAPVAAAAGLILAGTFSVMLLAPQAMMRQMGFAVALGIGVSAFLMAPLLVPALTTLFGRNLWTGTRTATVERTRDRVLME